MAGLTVARIILQILANLCLLVAIAITLTAMFSAQWQIADFGGGEVYQHGLYKDCETANVETGIRTTGDWLCFWKFDQINQRTGYYTAHDDVSSQMNKTNMELPLDKQEETTSVDEESSTSDIPSEKILKDWNSNRQVQPRNQLKDWQVQTLALLGSACAFSLLAVISANVTCCLKHCSIPWFAFSFVASIASLAGIILYLRWASESSNRFFRMKGNEVEQHFGQSFDMAVAGCALFFVGTILAAIGIAVTCLETSQNNNVRTTTHTKYAFSKINSDV